MRATDRAIRTLAAGDANMLREMLHLFGQVFEEPETYGGQQPDDAYLLRLLSSDSFVAIAALREGAVVGGPAT